MPKKRWYLVGLLILLLFLCLYLPRRPFEPAAPADGPSLNNSEESSFSALAEAPIPATAPTDPTETANMANSPAPEPAAATEALSKETALHSYLKPYLTRIGVELPHDRTLYAAAQALGSKPEQLFSLFLLVRDAEIKKRCLDDLAKKPEAHELFVEAQVLEEDSHS